MAPPDGLFLNGFPRAGEKAWSKKDEHTKQADDSEGLSVQFKNKAALASHEEDASKNKNAKQNLFRQAHGTKSLIVFLN